MLKKYFVNRANERSTFMVALFAAAVLAAHFALGLQLTDAFDIGASVVAAFHAALPGE